MIHRFFLLAIVFASTASAQDALSLARLNQDVQLLQQQLKRLALQVEVLQTRNAQLEQAMAQQAKTQRDLAREFQAQEKAVAAQLEGMAQREAALKADVADAKREILAAVSSEVDSLASQTQSALDTIRRQPAPTPTASVSFGSDFPSTGEPYNVQPGDTLSGIASRFGSRVRWIQDANKIADPSKLRAGQTIFIPVSE